MASAPGCTVFLASVPARVAADQEREAPATGALLVVVERVAADHRR